MIVLRQADLSDITEMKSLFVETIRATCRHDYSEAQIEAWIASASNKERWKSAVETQYFLVAETDQKVVGFASLENGSYIDFLYVHKDYQRQGIATLLFENLKSEAVRLGIGKLKSDVSKSARSFFEAKGFFVVRENRKVVERVELINYLMVQ